jgi:hypothetical protein
MVNPSVINTTVHISVRNAVGTIIGTASQSLPAKTKVAIALRNLTGLAGVVGQRGSAEFSVANGTVVVLGLRFNATSFTSIPTAEK